MKRGDDKPPTCEHGEWRFAGSDAKRAGFRRATERGEVVANPTLRVRLPADRRRRDRVARPAEVAALLAALPDEHRALWATAIYAGLRRGELQALRWQSVDLEYGLIQVEASWDRVTGPRRPEEPLR